MDTSKHLDLRLLEQFLVVCDALSMTAAAERLGMSVPAVSQLVVRLERDLHITLFERNRQGLRLTPAGAELRDRTRVLLSEEGEALESLKAYQDRLIPRLRLHVLLSVATTLMPAIVSEFDDLVGKINLRSGPSGDYVKEFLNGEVDLLITSDELGDIPGIEQHFLCEERLIGIVPADVPADRRRPELLAGKLPFVRFMRGHGRQQMIENYLADIGLDPPHDIECSFPAPMLELVSRGLAWTMATPLSVDQMKASFDKVAWMELAGPVPSRKIHLLTHAGRYLDLPGRLARRCCAALQETVDEWARGQGNEVLVNSVRVAGVAPSVAPRPLRHGQAVRLQASK
jgi:LysR family transcriptional regulator, nitrogen assimilation regulatory protein